jgi:hypothetical protein
MWITLFGITAAIAIALSVAAVIMESGGTRYMPS